MKKTAQKQRQPRRTPAEPVVQPIPGESLTSWIGALAQQQDLDIKPLLRELHLDRLGGLSGAEMRLSDPVVRRMEKLTGVDAERLHAMTLARYAGNALPHLPLFSSDGVAVQQWHKGAWSHHSQARWCPKCLRGNDGPRWLLRWKLPWSFACVDHGVYVVTECQACCDTVQFRQDAPPERTCENWTVEGEWIYSLGEPCGFPLVMCQPVPVSDDSVLALQTRINAWLDGSPTHEDRQLVALAAVLIPLVSPSMVRRGDPLLRYAVRSPRGTSQRQRKGRRPWNDSLRVAAAVYAADQLLRRRYSASEVAEWIADLRLLDHRRTPWRMDMSELAYGPSLRPNPFVEPLVHRGLITLGGWL
ncbi:TniQ family protein [Streptomyces sp. PSKA54]|uniref:TniQ family protein n=1 Tax=Streptomyces himalayensis subsp. aureolus TaxID=2758039 RepID=A0A7W2HEU1_9ACTN|nr:TniQ family protein [Streptomyces himalayensis]MBA4861136.1 TniQ family protein [Streptomyces himalayensis subsp. aureolus]